MALRIFRVEIISIRNQFFPHESKEIIDLIYLLLLIILTLVEFNLFLHDWTVKLLCGVIFLTHLRSCSFSAMLDCQSRILCWTVNQEFYAGLSIKNSMLDCQSRGLCWTVNQEFYAGLSIKNSMLDCQSRILCWTVNQEFYAELTIKKSMLNCQWKGWSS